MYVNVWYFQSALLITQPRVDKFICIFSLNIYVCLRYFGKALSLNTFFVYKTYFMILDSVYKIRFSLN